MVANKEVTKLIRQIEQWPGWRVEQVKAGWMAYPPDRNKPGVLIHGTPSDHRAWRNTIARLRRSGGPI